MDAAEFRSFNVSVVEDEAGGDSALGVSGPFQVFVEPADRFGNLSQKVFVGNIDVSDSDSLKASSNLLASRVPAGNLLGTIWVELASNRADARVPAGPQKVEFTGGRFLVTGPNESGQGLLISARSVGAPTDTVGVAKPRDAALGISPALAFAPEGVAAAVPTPIAAPSSLIVQDYKGTDGEGDQGGFVMMTFPRVEDARVKQYRVYREISVSTGLDTEGNVMVLDDPVMKFLSWVVISQHRVEAGQPIRAIVPSIDNKASRWGIASESVASAERHGFKVASSLEHLEALGFGEGAQTLTEADAAKYTSQFGDLVVAALDPQLPDAGGSLSKQALEGMTISESVRAVDDIAPRPATGAAVSQVDGKTVVSWTLSEDDRPVGFIPYRGYAIPIPGVTDYHVLVGNSEDGLDIATSASAGSGSTILEDVGTSFALVRVDAADTEHQVAGESVSASGGGRPIYLDADGNPVYILAPGGDTPFIADFDDFLVFASSFNKPSDSAEFVVAADTNDDGVVGFADFLNFAGSFGKTAVTSNGQSVGVATKAAVSGE